MLLKIYNTIFEIYKAYKQNYMVFSFNLKYGEINVNLRRILQYSILEYKRKCTISNYKIFFKSISIQKSQHKSNVNNKNSLIK